MKRRCLNKYHLFIVIIIIFAVFTNGCYSVEESSFSETSGGENTHGCHSIEESSFSETSGGENTHDFSVMFINVGRADAALIKIDGLSYLIDTGSKNSVPSLYAALEVCGTESLKGVFLTHKHDDHIGGMEAIAQRYDVETLYSSRISINNKIDDLADELDLSHIKLSAGDTVNVANNICFEVLGPIAYNSDDDNDNSLILKLNINGRTLLFTGDMQFDEEATLLDAGVDLSADVLKVGNHGNPDATSNEFADAVSPQVAIISTDTSDDTDSANKRVISALKDADVLVTEEYTYGILLTITYDGIIQVENPEKIEASDNIEIKKVDIDTQTVTLKNNGEDTDMSGFYIYSQDGSEVFVFPQESIIEKGQTISVACKKNEGDYIWDQKKVWSNDEEEAAVLYDRYGNILSSMKIEAS